MFNLQICIALSLCLCEFAAAHPTVVVSSRFSDGILIIKDGAARVFADGGAMDNPNGVAFGPDRHLYVGMGDGSRVARYHGLTGVYLDDFIVDRPGTPEDEDGGLLSVRDILFRPDGNLYVSSGATDQVLRYDGRTGAFLGVFAESFELNGPIGLTFGPDGHLYVSSGLANRVLRFDGQTGEPIGTLVSGNSVLNPTGLETGADGSIYVASGQRDRVRRYSVDGTNLGTVADGEGLDIPIGIAIGPDDLLYVASFATDEVLTYNRISGDFAGSLVSPGDAGLDGTHFFAFPPCWPDFAEPTGTLDLADIVGFLEAFLSGDTAADFAEPHGSLDLADVSAFAVLFSAGCP